MSRWCGCPCGAEQSDVAFPAPNKLHLITDADLDAVTLYGHQLEEFGEPGDHDDDAMSANGFEARARACWLCWNCGRLLVFEKDGQLTVYEKKVPSENR